MVQHQWGGEGGGDWGWGTHMLHDFTHRPSAGEHTRGGTYSCKRIAAVSYAYQICGLKCVLQLRQLQTRVRTVIIRVQVDNLLRGAAGVHAKHARTIQKRKWLSSSHTKPENVRPALPGASANARKFSWASCLRWWYY